MKCTVVAFENLQNKTWLLRNVMINEKGVIKDQKKKTFLMFRISLLFINKQNVVDLNIDFN